jgi:hypothetical protein
MDTWVSPLPDWNMAHTADFGYTRYLGQLISLLTYNRIHIPNRDKFHLEFILNSNGTLYDDVWIKNNPERYVNLMSMK